VFILQNEKNKKKPKKTPPFTELGAPEFCLSLNSNASWGLKLTIRPFNTSKSVLRCSL